MREVEGLGLYRLSLVSLAHTQPSLAHTQHDKKIERERVGERERKKERHGVAATTRCGWWRKEVLLRHASPT